MLFLPSGLKIFTDNGIVDVDCIQEGEIIPSFNKDVKTKIKSKKEIFHPIYEIIGEFGSILSGQDNIWGVKDIHFITTDKIEYVSCNSLSFNKNGYRLVFSQYVIDGELGTDYKGFLYGLIVSNYMRKFLLFDSALNYNIVNLSYSFSDIPKFLNFFKQISNDKDSYYLDDISYELHFHGGGLVRQIDIDYLINSYEELMNSLDKAGYISIILKVKKDFIEELNTLISSKNFYLFSKNILKKSFKYRLNFLSGFFAAYGNSSIDDFRYSKDRVGTNYLDLIQSILSSVGIPSFISKREIKSWFYYTLSISYHYYMRLIENDNIDKLYENLNMNKINQFCYSIFDIHKRDDIKRRVWGIELEHDIPIIVSGMICKSSSVVNI